MKALEKSSSHWVSTFLGLFPKSSVFLPTKSMGKVPGRLGEAKGRRRKKSGEGNGFGLTCFILITFCVKEQADASFWLGFKMGSFFCSRKVLFLRFLDGLLGFSGFCELWVYYKAFLRVFNILFGGFLEQILVFIYCLVLSLNYLFLLPPLGKGFKVAKQSSLFGRLAHESQGNPKKRSS